MKSKRLSQTMMLHLCTLTPPLPDPIVNQELFRKGLVHIVGRMAWYMHLALLLLPNSWQPDDELRGQRNVVRERLIGLHRKVLELEMNYVCAAASVWNAAGKNVIGWDSVDKLVKTVLELDGQFAEVVEKHCVEGTRERLLQLCRDVDMSAATGSEATQ
ncbi:uncharacterized protein MAM_06267 [Metarhizium album ARSEF 1941]|uniref:NWD NACHT-NTPase N-terminal domain-containing protein n=1 Tax=Metarhizium album (strain ARSEF 1941) TaxID=1081103 RepID=A0A0B2WSH6_METAS|nr:uncharacterized protein MAM_06267 [Metarhizium album ARSEF 1941]KHN95905.1 hypothetical protein MAM_06267 [Metarhizium album ARSEF 1941]